MVGVTPTETLRYINRNLGVKLQELELTENEIMEIVFQETLPTYSKFFPYYRRFEIKSSDKVEGKRNTFYIHPDNGLEIIGIHKVWVSNTAYIGQSLLALTVNPIENQLLNDAVSQICTPVTWHFFPPNMMEIMPSMTGLDSYLIEAKCVHPKHLRTITLHMRDHFMRLALLDVLVSLYPLRKRFQSMNSAFGSIEPFIEQVESSIADRQQLLETFHENVLKDANVKRLFIS